MLECKNVSIAHDTLELLKNTSFAVQEGEILAILGKSGCGKTTLLQSIAGVHPLQQGDVLVGGVSVNKKPIHERGIVSMTQEALLFPTMNVRENIGFGISLKMKGAMVAQTVDTLLVEVGLKAEEYRMPDQLSGGQKQRVALARALAIQPAVLLLDEPFSSLDPITREEMQQLLIRTIYASGTTTVLVTHDRKEALILGTQFGILENKTIRVLNNKTEFIHDSSTGIVQEQKFWAEQQ